LTSLRHDTAEAILIGLCDVLEVGWLDEPSEYAYVDLKLGRLSSTTQRRYYSKDHGDQSIGSHQRQGVPMAADYTPKQGQYLAFIYYYTKINRVPPAEIDMQRYFQTTPPAVHDMVKSLHSRGLISREPGKPRTIRVLLPREELPDLE